MSNFFLRSRHYLLFIFLFIPTLISIVLQTYYQIWMQRMQFAAIESGQDPFEAFRDLDVTAYKGYFVGFLMLSAITLLVQYGWYWSVANDLRKYVPAGGNLKPQRFKAAWFLAVTVQIGTLVGMYFAFDYLAEVFNAAVSGEPMAGGPSSWFTPENISSFFLALLLYGLVALLGFLALVYIVYYVGRTLRSIEYDEPRRGSDALGYSVLAYFLFIGVWVLQPKINRLVDGGRMNREDSLV